MVRKLSATGQHKIENAVRAAEKETHTNISVTIVPVSDTYFGYILFDSLILAGLIDYLLYVTHHLPNLYLLAIAGAFVLLTFVPFYRRLMIRFLPKSIRHQHAARSAVFALHKLEQQWEDEKPVVLLYISLGEHYVHVLHSRSLKGRLTKNEWQKIVKIFTKTMKKSGLEAASLQAIEGLKEALRD